MATIGTFTKTNAGFSGTIQTMGLKAKVAITPVEKRGDTAPDNREFVGKVEIGADWVRTSKGSGRGSSASSLTTRASRHRSTPTSSSERVGTN